MHGLPLPQGRSRARSRSSRRAQPSGAPSAECSSRRCSHSSCRARSAPSRLRRRRRIAAVSTPQPPGNSEPPTPSIPSAAAPSSTGSAPPRDAVQKEDRASTWQPWLYVKIGLLVFAVIWATAFVVQNSKRVNVHCVFATANVHLIWMILLCLGVGLLAGMLVSQLYRHRRRAQLAKKSASRAIPVRQSPLRRSCRRAGRMTRRPCRAGRSRAPSRTSRLPRWPPRAAQRHRCRRAGRAR